MSLAFNIIETEPQNRTSLPSWRRFIDSTKIKRLIADPYITWHESFGGFRVGESVSERPGRLLLCLIPYWIITLPLTVLSVYMLLSKSRQTTSRNMSRFTANERT